MNIRSDIYDKFSCIGGNCRRTCCVGWSIMVGDETNEFYQNFPGEFGDYLRENLSETENGIAIRMTEEKHCPFLDEDGLCQIYQNCGEERMCDICKVFPRVAKKIGEISFFGLSLSCEEVLQIIYKEREPLSLVCDWKTESNEELPGAVLYVMWAAELLQDCDVPFCVSLGTVLYTGMNAERYLAEKDSVRMSLILKEAPNVLEQFRESKETFDRKQLYQTAENRIFQVVDAFCQIAKISGLYYPEFVLWDEEVFRYSDEERHLLIRDCLARRGANRGHIEYMRRLASAFLLARAGFLQTKEGVEEWLFEKFANYMILAAVLPLIWQDAVVQDRDYFSRLACLGRLFEHSDLMHKFVSPVIQDLSHPDVMAYVFVYMVLFDADFFEAE